MLQVEQTGVATTAGRPAELQPQVVFAENTRAVVVATTARPAGSASLSTTVMEGPFAVWHKSPDTAYKAPVVPPEAQPIHTPRRHLDSGIVMDGPFAVWHENVPYSGGNYPNTQNRYYASTRHGSGF